MSAFSRSKLGALQPSEKYWFGTNFDGANQEMPGWVSFPGWIYTTAQSHLVNGTPCNAKMQFTFRVSSKTYHC